MIISTCEIRRWYFFECIKINILICVFYIKWKFIKSTHFFALCTKRTYVIHETPFTQFIQKNLTANQFSEIKTKHSSQHSTAQQTDLKNMNFTDEVVCARVIHDEMDRNFGGKREKYTHSCREFFFCFEKRNRQKCKQHTADLKNWIVRTSVRMQNIEHVYIEVCECVWAPRMSDRNHTF